MPMGPGKYDDLCTEVRQKAKAAAVVVIVLEGEHGSGFSVQAIAPGINGLLPKLLRQVADEVERCEQAWTSN